MVENDCIFCKMVAGQIGTNKIYEDEHMLAFYDIDPKAPVHFLVIPKQHIQSVHHLQNENSEVIGRIFVKIADIAKELELDNGYRIVTNCGKDGGQSVNHLHFHVLAKRALAWPPG